MNNFNKMVNFSPTAQQPNSPIRSLFFKVCLITTLMLSLGNTSIIAQPNSFTITGCTSSGTDVSGEYIRSATDVEGCPCYERTTDNTAIGYFSGVGGDWAYSLSPCASFAPFFGVYTYVDCDITTSTADTCDPATTLNQPADSLGVPTLSEWGLIVLALLLMTLGTLYLVQPKFRGVFSSEGQEG